MEFPREQHIQRRERRRELESLLPPDLELGGDLKSSKWSFDGGLFDRKYSESKEDKAFFDYLKLRNKKDNAENEELKTSLLETIKENRSEIGEVLSMYVILQKLLSNLANQGLWIDYANLLAKAKELGLMPSISNHQSSVTRLNNIFNKDPQTATYFRTLVISHLQSNLGLRDIVEQKGLLASFHALHEGFKAWNSKLDPTKQVKDVDNWFFTHQEDLAVLMLLGQERAEGLMRSYKSKGLLALEGLLNVARPVLQSTTWHRMVANSIALHSIDSPKDMQMFLETASAYQKLNKEELFKQINSDPEIKNIQEVLNKSLLQEIAASLAIDLSKAGDDAISGWAIEYLPNLSSNEEIIEERIKAGEENYDNVQALYKFIVKHAFLGDYYTAIENIDEEDEVGKDVAMHNAKVHEVFNNLGVDWNNWIEYLKTEDFDVSTEIKVDNLPKYKEELKQRAEDVAVLIKKNLKDVLRAR